MKKAMKWTALLLAVMMLAGCAQKTQTELPELIEPAGVESDMAVAYIDDIYETVFYSASIKPYVESLAFTVSGQVMEINAHPGMMVEEGDVLIELDQANLQDRIDQIQQSIQFTRKNGQYSDEIAELDIDIAETDLRRLQENETAIRENETALTAHKAELLEKEAALKENEAELMAKAEALKSSASTPSEAEPAPEAGALELAEKEIGLVQKEIELVRNELAVVTTDLTQTESAIALAVEGLALAEKEVALKKNEITQMQTTLRQNKEMREIEISNMRKELSEISISLEENVLRAPFSGRIIYGDILAPGSWVSAEDPVVFLADDTKLSVVCEYIPQRNIEYAHRVYAQIGAKEYELKYVPIDPDKVVQMTLAGETLKTTFEIVASEDELKELEAGQFVAIYMLKDYVKDALVVPTGAVQTGTEGKFVYVDQDGVRVKRSVKTGTLTMSLTEIVEGLEEGEVVYVKE